MMGPVGIWEMMGMSDILARRGFNCKNQNKKRRQVLQHHYLLVTHLEKSKNLFYVFSPKYVVFFIHPFQEKDHLVLDVQIPKINTLEAPTSRDYWMFQIKYLSVILDLKHL